MEFAASALIILILLLPGFILQVAYTKGLWRWNSPTSNNPLTEQIPRSIFWASVLHTIWCYLSYLLGYVVNFNSVTMLVLGSYGHDDELFSPVIDSFTGNIQSVALYFVSLYAASGIFGYLAHYGVRRCRLDRKFRLFRFNNDWFYLLKGEITQFGETPDVEGEVTDVFLTTVVHHSKGDYLYTGYMVDYFFDKTGNLDRIVLRDTERRDLSHDKTPEKDNKDKYYPIDGDYFILRYSEMNTINLYYLAIVEEQDTPDDIEIIEVNSEQSNS